MKVLFLVLLLFAGNVFATVPAKVEWKKLLDEKEVTIESGVEKYSAFFQEVLENPNKLILVENKFTYSVIDLISYRVLTKPVNLVFDESSKTIAIKLGDESSEVKFLPLALIWFFTLLAMLSRNLIKNNSFTRSTVFLLLLFLGFNINLFIDRLSVVLIIFAGLSLFNDFSFEEDSFTDRSLKEKVILTTIGYVSMIAIILLTYQPLLWS